MREVLVADPDGRADPGEVVWTLVAYDDDPFAAKDRPVLIVGRRDPRTVLALMLSSQSHRADDRDWISLGTGGWDAAVLIGQRPQGFAR